MGNEQFTDGPWRIDQDPRPNMQWNLEVDAKQGRETICFMTHDGTALNEKGRANANLIAAAPDMYKALKKVNSLLYTYQGDPEGTANKIADAIREPLQKAQNNK